MVEYLFVPGKPFQHSLMFLGKARSLPTSGASERCFIHLGYSFTSKHKTKLERLAMDKHSNLVRKSANYGQFYYSIGTWCQ